MLPPSALLPRPYRLQALARPPQTLADNVLACIEHGPGGSTTDGDPRYIRVPLPVLSGPAVELWETDGALQVGREEGIAYAQGDALLFAHLQVDAAAMRDTRSATAAAYTALLAFFARRPGWHWIRTWNYIGDIHRNSGSSSGHGDGDAERYRQFVLGRHEVLAAEPGFESRLPAATAIGTPGEDMLIYVLAATTPGVQIENPRQVSAFRYPRQYGPRSPSFSRARRLEWTNGSDLIVSGTASVVGHETAHPGDPAAQLRETLANLCQLRDAVDGGIWHASSAKLFVRDAGVYAQTQALAPELRALTGDDLCVLVGDICRSDLALEIEVLLRR